MAIFGSFVRRCLHREVWLPIVNSAGKVYGKIAQSVSLPDNQYMHPVIRIALTYKGMIYLSLQNVRYVSEPGKMDYPLEHFLLFKESLDDGFQTMLQQIGKRTDLRVRFICRYVHSHYNRLIYLYICNISDEKQLKGLKLQDGKWWTQKQIEDNLNTNLFSICFEKEYPVLSTTALSAEQFMQEELQGAGS
ncbi:hypothetical protein FACS189413_00770 [Bacteroidia bacterium]|nr:hypothetical protein FACS189463_2490 [Bacteroidia bacterium]GHU66913.1 hypothetical protein FACS189413_00770 [Bacteroidia bacterium]